MFIVYNYRFEKLILIEDSIKVTTENIDADGFNLKIEADDDCHVWSAGATWVGIDNQLFAGDLSG